MSRPIHFEIPADQPERAIAFYSGLFNWQFSKWDGGMPYWIVKTGEGPGIDGGLLPRHASCQGVVNTIGVDDLDAKMAAAVSGGGTLALPKTAVPGVGWLAYVVDPEGNTFGMMQADAHAK